MIAAWMAYALLIGALLALAAWLVEEVVRLRGGAVRLLWLGALLATVGLVALAPLRAPSPAPRLALTEQTTSSPAVDGVPSAEPGIAARPVAAARGTLASALEAAGAVGSGAMGTALAVGWGLLTAATLALGAATLLRARRARRAWPVAWVAGTPVRVAPRVGPAVLGICHPEVVVPAWLLAAPPEEQRLVVLHEAEHVRTRDPLVLALGSLAVALMPWNPAAWWMLLRLRAAVEMDCDARVLRRGVQRHAYGTLLIEIAGRGPGLSLGAPALAGSPSTLERRLRAMNARLPRFAVLRASLLGGLALAALAGACDASLPTSADEEKMDVAYAPARAERRWVERKGEVTYFLDGKEVSRDEAHAFPAERLVWVETTQAASGSSRVNMYTTPRPEVDAGARMDLVVAANGDHVVISGSARPGGMSSESYEGLLIIDGVVSEQSALRRLHPETIVGVSMSNGSPAEVRSDSRAANGVIRITTRAGLAKP